MVYIPLHGTRAKKLPSPVKRMWIGASINERKGAYCLAAGNGTRIVETFRHIGKDLKYAYGLGILRSLKEVSDQTKGSIHLIVPLPGLSRAIFESQDSLFKEIKDMIMSRKIDVFVENFPTIRSERATGIAEKKLTGATQLPIELKKKRRGAKSAKMNSKDVTKRATHPRRSRKKRNSYPSRIRSLGLSGKTMRMIDRHRCLLDEKNEEMLNNATDGNNNSSDDDDDMMDVFVDVNEEFPVDKEVDVREESSSMAIMEQKAVPVIEQESVAANGTSNIWNGIQSIFDAVKSPFQSHPRSS